MSHFFRETSNSVGNSTFPEGNIEILLEIPFFPQEMSKYCQKFHLSLRKCQNSVRNSTFP